jgi:hypothetical protein
VLIGLVVSAQAQPPAGTPPAPSYKVSLRFQIQTDRQQRYAFFRQMLARLERVGFKADPGRPGEEIYGNMLSGTMPATGLNVLRTEPFLRTAILVPAGYDLPADAERTVLVRLELATVLGPGRQSEVANQARAQLRSVGFIENEGYVHAGHAQLLGRLSAPALMGLLREEWEVTLSRPAFQGPTIQIKTPLIRLATVIPEPSPPTLDVRRAAPAEREYLDRISPDLRAYLAKVPEGDVDKLIRVELVLRGYQFNREARSKVVDTEAMFIPEGSFGPVVSGLVTPSRIPLLAQSPIVSSVRLPQAADPYVLPGNNVDLGIDFVPLGRELLPSISPVSLRPKPPGRTIIVGDDFRGYERHLPKNVTLVDVTAENRPSITPAPVAEGDAVGQSTLLAAAFLKSHPAEDVMLVRIDSAMTYQVAEIGNANLGFGWQTEAIAARKEELRLEADRLETERIEVRLLRRRVLSEFGIDDDSKAKREEYRKRQNALDAMEKEYFAKLNRFQKLVDAVARIKGASTIAVMLQWDEGYPDLPGQRPQLRFLSNDVLRAANWFQAVGRRPGQVWSGLFRDLDGDGVMEFTNDLRLQRADLAFLSWKPLGVGNPQQSLPEGAVVEVTLNWSEAHDPLLSQEARDIYRKPLADLTVSILRQRDPTGKTLPTDVFEVVGRSPFLPERVENDPRFSIYQNTVRFVVPPGGGRFALQIAGSPPMSTLPAGVEPTMPEKQELRPKLVLEVVDPKLRNQGRVVFEQFATPE